MFPSSTKREFRHFHVVVGQRRQRNVQKKRDARAKLLFCRSRCRRCRRCLSSLLVTLRSNYADGNENVEKTIRFYIKQNNNFARASRFLYISLPLFARLRRVLWITQTSIDEILFLFLNLDVVPRNFMDYVNKHRRNFVFFLNLGMVPRNSIPGGFAIFDKVSG